MNLKPVRYAIYFCIVYLIDFVSNIFSPPVFAMCDCLYNDVKGYVALSLPLVFGLGTVYLVDRGVKRGGDEVRLFAYGTVFSVFLSIAMGVLVYILTWNR